jgi:hypothetical protein
MGVWTPSPLSTPERKALCIDSRGVAHYYDSPFDSEDDDIDLDSDSSNNSSSSSSPEPYFGHKYSVSCDDMRHNFMARAMQTEFFMRRFGVSFGWFDSSQRTRGINGAARKMKHTRTELYNIRSVELEFTAPRCSGNKDRRQHRRKHPRPFNIQQRTPQKQSEWIIPHMRAF